MGDSTSNFSLDIVKSEGSFETHSTEYLSQVHVTENESRSPIPSVGSTCAHDVKTEQSPINEYFEHKDKLETLSEIKSDLSCNSTEKLESLIETEKFVNSETISGHNNTREDASKTVHSECYPVLIDGDKTENSTDVLGSEHIKRNPKFQSICWKFMTLLPDKKTVKCNLCKHILSYIGSSTSNLMRHMSSKHPTELDVMKSIQQCRLEAQRVQLEPTVASTSTSTSVANLAQPILSQTIERTSKYKPDINRKKQVDDGILDMIVADMQPLSFVEQRGFRKLMHIMDPKYEIVSRKRLREQLLPCRYQEVKKLVMDELQSVSHLSIATDSWTSRENRAYTTIMAHFITSDWKLHTRMLMTGFEGSQHNAENLAAELESFFREFSITGKVTTVVTDNAKNIKNAVDILKIQHLSCFAHTLNLVIRESIKGVHNVKAVQRKISDIVTFFHSSTLTTNGLRQMHVSKGTQFRKLKQFLQTQWSSTYDMLQSYLPQHKQVTSVLCFSGKVYMCLEENEVDLAKEVMEVLEPFHEATTELSSEKHTSASKVIPLVNSLRKISSRGTSHLSKKLNESLNTHFAGAEDEAHLKLATLLDPRFKKAAFCTPDSAEKAVDILKEIVGSIRLPGNEQQIIVEDEISSPPPKKRSLVWGDFDEEIEQSGKAQLSEAEVELRHFLDSQGIRRDKNPLSWWKENAPKLPRLEIIAKDVLAIPATSVHCERIFSNVGEPISIRRAQLKKSYVDMIMFLNHNVL